MAHAAEMVKGSDGVWRVVEPERVYVTAAAPIDFWPLGIAIGVILFVLWQARRTD